LKASLINLEIIREILEESQIIVERWFYRGSRAPERLFFEDFEDFEEYLNSKSGHDPLFQIALGIFFLFHLAGFIFACN